MGTALEPVFVNLEARQQITRSSSDYLEFGNLM